jgi:hypothetical protein
MTGVAIKSRALRRYAQEGAAHIKYEMRRDGIESQEF